MKAVVLRAMWLRRQSENTEAEHIQLCETGKTFKAKENKNEIQNIVR